MGQYNYKIEGKKMQKVAAITGGSSGLGIEFAKILGKQGYFLVIIARNQQKLNETIINFHKSKLRAKGLQCDITDEEQLKNVFNNIKQEFQIIDFLILNAGVVTCKLLSNFKNIKELRYDLDINLWGTILSTYTFLPAMASGGKILMISSAFGLMGPAAYAVYSASKVGIINFAESLRRELLCKNISVHVACPGNIDTPQLRDERKHMPEWFKSDDPRKTMSPSVAARKILKKCNTKNKFLILISFDILMLVILTKVTPRRLRDYILDKMFPIPKYKSLH